MGPPVPDTERSGLERLAPRREKPPAQVAKELWDLILAYLRQETLEPLKAIRTYVAYGVVGSLLLGLGVIFLTMAGLRALQDETGTTFTGNWSWAPYVIVTVVLLLGAALTWSATDKKKKKNDSTGTKDAT